MPRRPVGSRLDEIFHVVSPVTFGGLSFEARLLCLGFRRLRSSQCSASPPLSLSWLFLGCPLDCLREYRGTALFGAAFS